MTRGMNQVADSGYCDLDHARIDHLCLYIADVDGDAMITPEQFISGAPLTANANPARLQSFTESYTLAVLQAEVELNVYTAGKKPQEHALDTTLLMLDMIQSKGVASIEHYVVNTRGGALRHTAEVLGVAPTSMALQDYLDGGNGK